MFFSRRRHKQKGFRPDTELSLGGKRKGRLCAQPAAEVPLSLSPCHSGTKSTPVAAGRPGRRPGLQRAEKRSGERKALHLGHGGGRQPASLDSVSELTVIDEKE